MKTLCTVFPSTAKEKEPCCYSIIIAVALEDSSAFKRAQTPAGLLLSKGLSSTAALGDGSAEPLGRGELPAPSSADELLRNGKGRAGNGIIKLHEFPAGRLLFRLETSLSSRVQAPHATSQGGRM